MGPRRPMPLTLVAVWREPNGTHFDFKVAGTLRVPSANGWLRHMECAYYVTK